MNHLSETLKQTNTPEGLIFSYGTEWLSDIKLNSLEVHELKSVWHER